MNDRQECWRPVVGFEGLYDVSDMGRVRRVGGRVRMLQRGPGGYLSIDLWRDNVQHQRLVHRLVAEAFLGPVPDGQEVNHRDGDKRNPAAANLDYVTRSENLVHAYANGLRPLVVPPTAKLTRQLAQSIRARHAAGGISMRALARLHDVDPKTIRSIISNRSWV